MHKTLLGIVLALGVSATLVAQSAADAPTLRYVFSAKVTLMASIEQGVVDGRRMRFVPISGEVYGPELQGEVLGAVSVATAC